MLKDLVSQLESLEIRDVMASLQEASSSYAQPFEQTQNDVLVVRLNCFVGDQLQT